MNRGGDKRQILINALDGAVTAYREKTRLQTLIARDAPDEEVLAPVAAAIEGCEPYQAVIGKSIFTIGTAKPIEARQLAELVLSRAEWNPFSDAADWLLRILRTETTTVVLRAAIWGVSIDEEIQFSDSSRLMQFDRLPPTYGKSFIADRKKWQHSNFVWYSDRHFDVPLTAYSKEITDVPFISDTDFAFDKVHQATQSVIEIFRMMEGVYVGHPLPLAYWLEFQDQELSAISNAYLLTWSLSGGFPTYRACNAAKFIRRCRVLQFFLQAFSRLEGRSSQVDGSLHVEPVQARIN